MSVPQQDSQASFFDTSFLIQTLFDAKNPYEIFRREIYPALQSMRDELCQLYCPDNGRPGIEPVIMACSRKLTDEGSGAVFEIREALSERITHICDRIARWIRLASKPPEARKVVFVFHKNECAGLEANVGGAAGLDSGQSVVEIMRRMQSQGYRIEDIPESGEALMQTILERKAIAEFRWTTVDEIIAKGPGVLQFVGLISSVLGQFRLGNYRR